MGEDLIREREGILSAIFLCVTIGDEMSGVTVTVGSYPIGSSPDNCQGILVVERLARMLTNTHNSFTEEDILSWCRPMRHADCIR